MAIMDSRRLTTALLITALVLSGETSEIKHQSDSTCVCNEVNLHQSHNSSERPCKTPHKPLNGYYNGKSDGSMYETGDTITYHCNRGYRLIGEAKRTCNETANGWQSQEPYCEPEYIGRVMRRLDRIEQRITTLENVTSGLRDIILSSKDCKSATTELLNPDTDRNTSRIMVCTKKTNVNDQDTVSKCLTMQLGERNGRSVSVFNWTVEDVKSDIPDKSYVEYDSEPFYHTVPGYKLRLKLQIWYDNDAQFDLMFVPSESDEQLRWPFSTPYDMTVLLKNGTEFAYANFTGQHPKCTFGRPTYSDTQFDCYTRSTGWASVWPNKKHVLKDGSLVLKIYMYN